MIRVDILSKKPILNINSAKAKILEILETGFVIPEPHCKKRMGQRGVYMPDILKVLQMGDLKSGQNDGDDTDNVFRVYGLDTDDDPLMVVVKIDERLNQLRILTVFGD